MAITDVEYRIVRTLRDRGALPLGGALLELGEANWYGDVRIEQLALDIQAYAPASRRDELIDRLVSLDETQATVRFDVAKIFWDAFLHPGERMAIDFNGTDAALQLNLNYPIDLGRKFDIVTNIGTAEHVFDIARVFRTIHEHTRPGGIMLHVMPLTGWLDHGFYNINPTAYWDVAAVNGYEVVTFCCAEIAPVNIVEVTDREHFHRLAGEGRLAANSLIACVFRKPGAERDFAVPIQGYYVGSISADAAASWQSMR